MAGGAQLPKHDFRDHLRGSLRPALILVGPHALAASAVDDLVGVIESWARDTADQQGYGNRIGVGCGRAISGNGELIILARPGGTTSSRQTHCQGKH